MREVHPDAIRIGEGDGLRVCHRWPRYGEGKEITPSFIDIVFLLSHRVVFHWASTEYCPDKLDVVRRLLGWL